MGALGHCLRTSGIHLDLTQSRLCWSCTEKQTRNTSWGRMLSSSLSWLCGLRYRVRIWQRPQVVIPRVTLGVPHLQTPHLGVHLHVKKDDGYQPRYIHLNIDGVVVKYHGDAVVREGVGGVADQEAGLAWGCAGYNCLHVPVLLHTFIPTPGLPTITHLIGCMCTSVEMDACIILLISISQLNCLVRSLWLSLTIKTMDSYVFTLKFRIA